MGSVCSREKDARIKKEGKEKRKAGDIREDITRKKKKNGIWMS